MTKMLRDEIPLNPHVAGLPPYNAGMNIAAAQKHSGRQDIAALASNENPDGCSPKVAAALAGLNPARYCDPACTTLRTALSHKLDVPADRIVFMGDSITQLWGLAEPADFGPARVNRGISGQTTLEMLARFRRDVIDLHPRAVVILAGKGHEVTQRVRGQYEPYESDAVVARRALAVREAAQK